VQFSARFSGTSQEVAVPMSAVSGIFAKETGYGFAFTIPQDPAAALAATLPQEQDIDAALDRDLQDARDAKDGGKGKPRPSHLQVIK
jgi:stringent starvation protein B